MSHPAADRTARRPYRRDARAVASPAALGVILLIWTLLPVYNMVLIALDDRQRATGALPPEPSFESFRAV